MTAKITLKALLQNEGECVMSPCVYDCASARAVELVGFKTMLLSGGELGESMTGMLEATLTMDELLWATTRICDYSPLPMTVDINDGGGTPLNVYRTCLRMAKAGALGVQLDDGHGGSMLRQAYLANVKAAAAALQGSSCILVARTDVNPKTDMEEAIARCSAAIELGADMTMVVGLNNFEDAKTVGTRVPGWKVYPDQNSKNGIPEVVNEEIYPYGFRMITFHYLLKVAMAAMLEAGIQNFKNKNNVYSNEIAFPNGRKGHSALPMMNMQQWFDLEGQFTGVTKVFKVPGED
jgi:2-methylisocitrate lyase-like PEP mutase family enzyme